MVWQRDVVSGEACCSLARDPLDRRRLAVCSTAGALVLVTLIAPQVGSGGHTCRAGGVGEGGCWGLH